MCSGVTDIVIKFKEILIEIIDGKALLKKCGNLHTHSGQVCVEVQIAGQDKPSHMGVKMANSSEGNRLKYLSHTQTKNTLTLKQRSEYHIQIGEREADRGLYARG